MSTGRQKRKQFPHKIKRMRAQIATVLKDKSNGNPLTIQVFLNDITKSGLTFFAPEGMPIGTEITVNFLAPYAFAINAKIASCWEYQLDTRVMNEHPLRFRLEASYIFLSDIQRRETIRFWEATQQEVRPPTAQAA